ncbi:MAG: alpha/beta fold hydrolase [Fodinibius sp.]|nr:alpha/beta fold hydrolase [Fodinibius sp.]
MSITFKNLHRWQKVLLVYGVLLILSHLTIWVIGNESEKSNDTSNEVLVQTVLEDFSTSDQKVGISYDEIYTGNNPNPPVLVMLPGGPEGSDIFKALADDISKQYRVVIPHLPGLGENVDDLPDYSFKSLAIYTNQFLDKLDLNNVHVLGYGLGGASAIFLANDYPEKVQTLSLVSSIGVQELELLGSYRLNHAVHGLQLGAVWVLHNAIPHFGLLQAIDIDVSYAKSHYESDQRPLRSHLKAYQKPMLILHGKDDPLVPLAAAKEHNRIVPQSQLTVFDAGHDLIQTHSDSVAQSLQQFISDAEAGNAVSADDASQQRIAQAQKPFSNVEFAKFEGASLVIIMLIIIIGTLISEDLTCIGAGLLAARGLIGFWPATLACFTGIFAGDIALYLAGRFLGRPAVSKAPFKWVISERDLEKSARWFDARGPAIIIATRFLPGSRLPTYFSAGVIGAGFWMFVFYFILAAVMWTPMLVGISKLLGNELMHYFTVYQDYALWVFIGAVIFLIMILKVVIPLFSYKGRRLLVSRYRRLTRWEYWSPIILYAPVSCYIIYLGIKYRCLTLFTATNPAIPDSGFVGESKTDILQLFDNDYIPQHGIISSDLDGDQMLQQAEQFMMNHNLNLPIALKPDVGERGRDVSIIRDWSAMKRYFTENSDDIIIQEYIAGVEFGVFYYRMPQEPEGEIFSITEKQLPIITGDGVRTLEELILEDEQAVSLAKRHLRQNEERLYQVPEDGEEVQIVDLGTHARGAIFRDGHELITDKLQKQMNEICEPVSGYYFGRFDIKVPSARHLEEGKDLKIIEVNGVTSESTNIYDADYSFIRAQKTLMEQWRIAFEIGNQNRQEGVMPARFWPFIRRVLKSLMSSQG